MRNPRRLTLLILTLVLLLPLLGERSACAAGTEEAVVGYYAAWASGQGYKPEDIPAERFTQINYAFAGIEDGQAVLRDPARDGKNLRSLTGLRKRRPGLKIVLSIGGWDESTYFSDAAAAPDSRQRFARSCVDLITEYGLDGIDLDWEYPVSGGAAGIVHRPQDKENFTWLLKSIRQALDEQSRRDGNLYVLTIAGAADGSYLSCIEPRAVAETVDHIFLMAYDFHGPWDAYADFNAPLHTPTDGPARYRSSVDDGISSWLGQGVPAEKLVLGMPLYGYIYQGVSSGNNGLYSRFNSAKSVPWNQVKNEYLTNSAYRQFRHAEAQAPYLYGNRSLLSYDDAASIAAKANLARQRGLGGIGYWELSQDRDADLIQSACTAWSGGGFRDVPPDAWYAEAVERLSTAGLMNGTGSGTFSPGQSVTRGQIAAILYRLAEEPAVSGSSFHDVPAWAYYSKAVAWAARRGIVEGFADQTFRPDLPVSRQQLSAILWRYAKLKGADSGERALLRGYQDAGDVSGYAEEPMSWALRAGILRGTKEGLLLPEGHATRGQTAVMLERFCELLENA